MRRRWERCDNCTAFVHRGDIGECHDESARWPQAGSTAMWPQVSPTDYCRRFTFDPEPLYAEVERLTGMVDALEAERVRRDDADRERARVVMPVIQTTTESE